jgi:2'-hydroxyisoflavone reductase
MIDRRTFLSSSLAASALACASSSPGTGARETGPAPSTKLKLLVLGGTGYLGPAVVNAARARGHEVTLFNRGKTNPGMFPDLEQLRGDRDGQLDALRGRKWDAVLDDTGFVPRIVRQSVELLAPNVRRYLFVSTLSVYSDEKTLDQDEGAPRAVLPPEAAGTEEVRKHYSALKAACEDVVTSVYGGRATVVRPGYIVGPRDPYDRLTYWVVRCDRGGDLVAPGDGSDPTQFIDVRDLGAFMVHLVEGDRPGAFNATGPETRLNMAGFLETCRVAAGGKGRLVWVPRPVLVKHGADPDDASKEHLPLWVPGHALGQISIAKALGAGLKLRPTLTTAQETLAWWKGESEERRAKMRGGLTPEQEQAILADVAR